MQNDHADLPTPANLPPALRGFRAALSFLKAPRIIMVVLMAFSATACSDVTAPGRMMDREAVENVMPSVNDARRRVASGIADVAVRQQLTITLSNLEIALRADDVDGVTKGMAAVETLLNSYSPRAHADRQEISAVMLVLAGVGRVASPDASTLLSH
jgi:hypothetical protein